MRDLEALSRELERSGRAGAFRELARSDEAKRLGAMVDRPAVEEAVRGGDTEALRKLLGGVLATPEGQRMAQRLRQMMEQE